MFPWENYGIYFEEFVTNGRLCLNIINENINVDPEALINILEVDVFEGLPREVRKDLVFPIKYESYSIYLNGAKCIVRTQTKSEISFWEKLIDTFFKNHVIENKEVTQF